MQYEYWMEHIVKDMMRERLRQAELHHEMERAGLIREGRVSPWIRRLVTYLRCLPAILTRRWRRCALPMAPMRDASPQAACRD